MWLDAEDTVITDKAILRFDKTSREMYLDSIHPGVTVEEVKEAVSWDLKVTENVKVIAPSTPEELRIIRNLVPLGIYTGDGLKRITFERYIQILEESFSELDRLYTKQRIGCSGSGRETTPTTRLWRYCKGLG